jgi:hypothetical protein
MNIADAEKALAEATKVLTAKPSPVDHFILWAKLVRQCIERANAGNVIPGHVKPRLQALAKRFARFENEATATQADVLEILRTRKLKPGANISTRMWAMFADAADLERDLKRIMTGELARLIAEEKSGATPPA